MSALDAVLAAIDAANAEDPRRVDGRAFEILYAERMSARLAAIYPDASDLLKIAARAQHLKRWEIPRADYPEGRKGYNDWRRACRIHHAALADEIMRANGYDAASIAHVGALIRKEQIKKGPRIAGAGECRGRCLPGALFRRVSRKIRRL
ncbi:DUF4202 domain-containing protein [Methylocystis parvus]|uniref:DUF4202 domain-containing protein n=1 Tax=Methylocystis parvus TaxID=134 RepID=UPI00244D9A91|nr:DUF4202 domain-containing protein [Methylocystis parvus]